jgi:hypothetical protein
MKQAEYQYLADTLSGRRQRDPEFEASLSDVVNVKAAERQRQLDARTPEERELEQRRYSLRTYGREHMRRYANPIVSDHPLGELEIPGDQIRRDTPQARGHNDRMEAHKSASPQIKGHSGEKSETWCHKDGRLKLQFHDGEPGCYMQIGLK